MVTQSWTPPLLFIWILLSLVCLLEQQSLNTAMSWKVLTDSRANWDQKSVSQPELSSGGGSSLSSGKLSKLLVSVGDDTWGRKATRIRILKSITKYNCVLHPSIHHIEDTAKKTYFGDNRRRESPFAQPFPVKAFKPSVVIKDNIRLRSNSKPIITVHKTILHTTYLCFWMSFTPFFKFPSLSDGLSL